MLRIVALGGLGEIGLNALVLETEDEALLVDCGILFPRDAPGVDLVLPDFAYLREIRDKLRGVVLTHGHEDHIGALPYLLRELRLPVWGSAFTLALLSQRLEELEVEAPSLGEIGPGARIRPGRDFLVEALHLTHSIPDALGLSIETPEGRLVHTGDFKLDAAPLGRTSDLSRLAELGRDGVLALLSDSTNADQPGRSRPEREVGEAFVPIFEEARGRIVVSTFASHIHRIQQVLDLSRRFGRKVVLLGRSMERNVAAALRTGHLQAPPELFLDVEFVGSRRDLTILAGGVQGEPRSALARLALGEEGRPLRLEEGDTAILSATPIPGNEVAVAAVLDALILQGVRVHHGEPVHASGHACRDELLEMLETVQPLHFVPVHGEVRHLVAHRELAVAAGVEKRRAHFLLDGQVLGFAKREAVRLGTVPVGRRYLDRLGGEAVEEEVMRERRLLAEVGVISAVVVVDGAGRAVRDPELRAQGVSGFHDGLQREIRREVVRALDELPWGRRDRAVLEEEIRLAVRRACRRALGRKPIVLPLVVET